MDEIDRKILAQLQQDSRIAVAELAEKVGVSRTVCWRRIKALEDAGIIRAQVALLNRNRLNLPVTDFVAIRTSRHDADCLQKFAETEEGLPEINEVQRMI